MDWAKEQGAGSESGLLRCWARESVSSQRGLQG